MPEFLTPPLGETQLRTPTAWDTLAQLAHKLTGIADPNTSDPFSPARVLSTAIPIRLPMVKFPLATNRALQTRGGPPLLRTLEDALTNTGQLASQLGGATRPPFGFYEVPSPTSETGAWTSRDALPMMRDLLGPTPNLALRSKDLYLSPLQAESAKRRDILELIQTLIAPQVGIPKPR